VQKRLYFVILLQHHTKLAAFAIHTFQALLHNPDSEVSLK